jgi:hypothetical protein
MATREDVYGKFGITAEAAQLYETELGTLLLGTYGLQGGWQIEPDRKAARAAKAEITAATLGRLLNRLKAAGVTFEGSLKDDLQAGLRARNLLFHGFYERHNFGIQTDEGRDLMMADLEELHDQCFRAWQLASAMSQNVLGFLMPPPPEGPD